MKFSIVASIFALASVGMAAPAPDDSVKISQAIVSYDKITSLAKRAPVLSKRGPCPEAGSGEISPCCFDGGPDENCKSKSNCYTRCGPTGPNDIGGPLGCLAGCDAVCPGTPEC